MAKLYKIDQKDNIKKVEENNFSDEPRDLEDFIMKNQEILGEIALINHQIITANNKKIDIWGVDLLEKRPIIIELKNTRTGSDVLTQILPYYDFLRNNPETLRLKIASDNKFKEKINKFNIDIESLLSEPKVIIMAPSFTEDIIKQVNYLTFDVQLVQISRYKSDDDVFVLVDFIEEELSKPTITRVMEDWDWEKYNSLGISQKKIDIAKGIMNEINKIIENEKLDLKSIFRKAYIPFQSGKRNVFWIDLGYTSWERGDVLLTMKLEKKPDLKSLGINIEHTKTEYSEQYHIWSIYFNKIDNLEQLIPIVKESYNFVVG